MRREILQDRPKKVLITIIDPKDQNDQNVLLRGVFLGL